MTQGKPMRAIFLFMVPFLIGNIFQEIYTLADSIIVGQLLGVDAFAGVGCASVVIRIFTEVILGVNSGFIVILSQEFGAQNKAGVRKCVATSMWIASILSIIMVFISFLSAKPVLNLTNTPREAFSYALDFMLVSCAGFPAMMAYNFFSGISKALGDSKIPLYFLVLSAILNVILDYFNVLILHLGVIGVAFATIISQVISSILCAVYVFKKYRFVLLEMGQKWDASWFYAKKCLRIALPISCSFAIGAFGRLFLQTAINDLGVDAVVGYGVARKIDSVLTLSFGALSSAITTYTSQNFGAKKINRIFEGVRANIMIGMTFCIIFGIIMCIFWDQLVGVFVGETEVGIKEATRQYVNIAISTYPAYCLLITFRNIMRAMGKTVVPIFADGVEIFMRSVGSLTLTFLLGYVGACVSVILSWYVPFLVIIVSYIFTIDELEKKFAVKNL